jgi:hypothetical protein
MRDARIIITVDERENGGRSERSFISVGIYGVVLLEGFPSSPASPFDRVV